MIVIRSAHGNPIVTAERYGPNVRLWLGATPEDPAEISPDEARRLAVALSAIAGSAERQRVRNGGQ